MSIFSPVSNVIMLEQRVRLLRGLSEVQVSHRQPITGVPALEPTPNMVTCTAKSL
jgi:hypothetical protein